MSILEIVLVMAMVMTTGPGGEQATEENTPAFVAADAEPIHFNGLEWRVGPDRDLRWDEARSWADSLGKGWRLPSIEELEGLYEAGVSVEAWGPFQCGGEWVWADFPGAWSFLHGDGVGYPTGMEPSTDHRTFAVRTAGGHD
jgi:hypothetical protein